MKTCYQIGLDVLHAEKRLEMKGVIILKVQFGTPGQNMDEKNRLECQDFFAYSNNYENHGSA